MVNSGKENVSFWAKHKAVTDDLIKAGCIIVSLKLIKILVDRIDG